MRQTDSQTDRQTDRQIERQADGATDIQKDNQTNRRTHRQAVKTNAAEMLTSGSMIAGIRADLFLLSLRGVEPVCHSILMLLISPLC